MYHFTIQLVFWTSYHWNWYYYTAHWAGPKILPAAGARARDGGGTPPLEQKCKIKNEKGRSMSREPDQAP